MNERPVIRSGIAVAGNIITDMVKTVNCYPEKGMLAYITGVKRAVGGCVPNTAIQLAKIDSSIPVSAFGRIGDDENGRFILTELERMHIDCGGITVSESKPTGFCDVMSLPDGERTFFNMPGANAEFSPEDISLTDLKCAILHIGYIMLLDRFDERDKDHGTVMARFLHDAKELGIRTSIDTVSDSCGDYAAVILPALRYCDYVIINEIECCRLTGLPPRREDGSLHTDNIRKTMEYMAECGVGGKIFIHSKEAGFCLDVQSGKFTYVASLELPRDKIRGSVGAGDAFCAAVLYGIYNGYDDRSLLDFASAAAACNLFSENSTDGMLPAGEIREMTKKYRRMRS